MAPLFMTCTRNNARGIDRLLSDLDYLFGPRGYTAVIVDDSTTARECDAVVEAAKRHESALYVTECARPGLKASYLSRCPPLQRTLRHARPLGSGSWNLPHARLFAILLFLFDGGYQSYETVCFLDDDIRLRGVAHAGLWCSTDVNRLRAELCEFRNPRALWAHGARYVGRVDTCHLEHLELALAADDSAAFATRGGHLLVRAQATAVPADPDPDSPGISGAFLLTNRASLHRVMLPLFYNEDWLWLSMLKDAGGVLSTSESPVVHDGERWILLQPHMLRVQAAGDVLHLAVTRQHGSSRSLEEAWNDAAAEIAAWIDELAEECRLRGSGTGRNLSLCFHRIHVDLRNTAAELRAGVGSRLRRQLHHYRLVADRWRHAFDGHSVKR